MLETALTLEQEAKGSVIVFQVLIRTAVLIDHDNVVHVEHECAACLCLQLFLVAVEVFCQTVPFRFVQHTEVLLNRCFGVQIRRNVELRIDGILLLPSLSLDGISDGAVTEELEVVESIAVEDVATFATLELKPAVDVDQSGQQTQLHTHITCEICRIGKSQPEHTTDTGIDDVNLLLPETKIDMDTKLGIEVSIELAFCIPAIESRCPWNVHTLGVSDIADADIESGQGTDVTIEQSEVNIDISPCRSTHHHTAIHLCLEVFEGCRAGIVGLADISTLHTTTLGRAIEELTDFLRNRWQLAVTRQLVTYAEVGIGSDVHTHHLRLEVNQDELASQVFIGLSQVEVPFGLVQFLSLLLHGDAEVERNGDFTHFGLFGHRSTGVRVGF